MTDIDSHVPRRDGLSMLDDRETKALERLLAEWEGTDTLSNAFQSVLVSVKKVDSR